ncbi:hypothetical protein DE146DRAFT_333147 [Phaeosphaeria sp. MPI-PUGE-AT-0046c]|nr:hypothetical protein DE146DRAFT_333147 [Phaeosphaeria sp. MPI-PUGE-AT-0046c]
MASGFRAAQVGPWSTSCDWNLRATQDGETRIPFRYHVRPVQNETYAMKGGFHRFLQLPAELQKHVLALCDSATLFQLMQTSYSTRQEAKKLFWSDPTSRYIVDGQWLQAGGHPRHTNYDLEALAHMHYIEVSFIDYTSNFIKEWREGEYYCYIRKGEEQRAAFWATLRRRFPRVIDVVLNEPNSKRRGQIPPEEPTQLATGSSDVMSISVSQLVWSNDKWYSPETRFLWRRGYDNHSIPTWDLTETSWNPHRIMPPIKTHSGLVGDYQRYDYNDLDLKELGRARDIHAIHATEAYYLHIAQAPCVCPWPACGLQFEQAGEWSTHHLEACLRRDDHEGTVPPPPSASIRTAFLHHDMILAQKRHQLSDEMMRMQAAWGEPDSPERRAVSHQFLKQLRDDPLYAGEVAPEESEIWIRYQRDMDGVGNPPFF